MQREIVIPAVCKILILLPQAVMVAVVEEAVVLLAVPVVAEEVGEGAVEVERVVQLLPLRQWQMQKELQQPHLLKKMSFRPKLKNLYQKQ